MSVLVPIQEYVHVFGNFDVYPRVYHFHRRYKDLVPRFTRVTGALPKCFHDDKLMREIQQTKHEFEGGIKLSVIGKRDIDKDDLVFNPVSKLPDSPVHRLGIVILHIDLEHLTERYFQEIRSKFKALTFDAKKAERKIFVYICCATTRVLTNEDITRFQDSVFAALYGDLEKYFNEQDSIFINPIACDLKTTISDTLEKYLASGFINIYYHLKRFEPINVDVCLEPLHVFETESVVCSLKDFLRNARAYVEVTINTDEKEKACTEIYDRLLKSLCHVARCSVVNLFARKYGLQVWICNGLLYEVQLEEALSNAISKNTQHHIRSLVEYVYEALLDGTVYSKKTKKFDFLYYAFKSDVEPVTANVEKKLQSMQKLSTIIRKMAFEAHGYLKQLNVANLVSFAEQQQSIPKELRQDLLNLKGVYGLGTVYGQLEIHVDKDAVLVSKSDDVKQDENNAIVAETDDIHLTSLADLPQEKLSNKLKQLRSDISLQMRKHDFKEQFVLRYIEKKHKEMGLSFEPGDRLFQRDKGKFGTLGGFIISKDGKVHGLTCAHVVGKNTFIDKNGPCPFSSCPKVINRQNGELKHVDIAALEVIPNSQEPCKQTLKECNECITIATVSEEYPEMIVGIPVFKYGAASGFTRGFIVSVDYSIIEEETEDYLVMIDIQPDLPVDFNETFDPITCIDDQSSPQTQLSLPDREDQIMSNDRDAFDEKIQENDKTVSLPSNHGKNTPEDISFPESAIITAESNKQCTSTVTTYTHEDNHIHLNDAHIKALEDMQCCGINTDETAHGNVAPRNTIVYARNLESSRTTLTSKDTSDEGFANDRDAFEEIMEENDKIVSQSSHYGENNSADIGCPESAFITESNKHWAETVTIYTRDENRIYLNDANIEDQEDMQCCGLNTAETAHGNVVPRNTIVYVRNLEGNRTTPTDKCISDEIFAKRGDSGSIICLIESTHTDIKHKALSMLSAGDLKIGGDESLKCLSFKLNVGFRMLKRTHNLDF